MPYCENCENFKEKMIITKFGIYMGYCEKLKIGRNIDSDICDKYQDDNKDKIIVHRAEIKLERLDEHFE
jgi:hypothetical protein